MERNILFAIMLIIIIIGTMVLNIPDKIRDIGSAITGYTTETSPESEATPSTPGSSPDPGSSPKDGDSKAIEAEAPEGGTPEIDVTSQDRINAAETSQIFKSPDRLSLVNKLDFSKAERIIIEELAIGYLIKAASESEYGPTEIAQKMLREIRLSMPKEDTEITVGVENKVYPRMSINIEA